MKTLDNIDDDRYLNFYNNDYNHDYNKEFSEEYLLELGSLFNKPFIEEKTCLEKASMNIFGKISKNVFKYDKTDKFYCDIYDYYNKGGIFIIVLNEIFEILSIILGVFFIFSFFILIDWNSLLQCGGGNKSCGDISLYFKIQYPNLFISMLILFGVLTSVYKIIYFVYNFKSLIYIYRFYKNILNISLDDLQHISWNSVITDVCAHYGMSLYNVTNIILREENYMIALINNNVININPIFYTKQLEINIRHLIFHDIYNLQASSLRKKLILYGILNLFLSVFIMVYIVIYIFVNYVDEFYSKGVKNAPTSMISLRKFSLYSKWKFREYNEVIHFFDKRLNKAVVYANEYISQFSSPVIDILCKFVSLFSGGFIGFFLILSILDENILLHVTYINRSLLFYAGIIGVISAYSRMFMGTSESKVNNPGDIMMNKVYKYTRYMPKEWHGKVGSYTVRDEFLVMFRYKLVIFLYDILSVITTPFIMIFILPNQSENIVNFIKENTVVLPNIGKICSFSEFGKDTMDKTNKKTEKSIIFFEKNHMDIIDSDIGCESGTELDVM